MNATSKTRTTATLLAVLALAANVRAVEAVGAVGAVGTVAVATTAPASAPRSLDAGARLTAVTRLITQDLVPAAALLALADSLTLTAGDTSGNGDATLASLADSVRARALFRTLDMEAAATAAARALASATASGNPLAQFHALRQQGTLTASGGDYGAATRLFRAALDAARRSGEDMAIATALGNLGTIAQVSSAYEEAAIFHTEALEQARRLGEAGLEAVIANNLGYLLFETGDHAGALRQLDRALQLAGTSGNAQIRFTQATARAMVQMGRGDAAGAVAQLQATLLREGAAADPYLRSEMHVFLARALSAAARPVAAGREARRAIALLVDVPLRALPAEVVLVDALIASGESREAAARARRAVARAASGTRILAELLEAQARALAAMGEPAAAYTVQLAAQQARERSGAERASARLGFLQARFDEQLAQRELALLREQRAASEARLGQSRQERNFALLLLLLVTVAAVLGARLLQRRRIAEGEAARMQRLEALGQLTGGVAHDFNNLMTVVEQSAGLLRNREAVRHDPLALRLIEETRGAAQTGAQITRQLLAFARRQPLDPQLLLLDVYLLGVRDLLARTLTGSPRLEVSVERPAPAVRADRAQLTAALINLVANAREASDPTGVVTVRVTRLLEPDGHVALSVVDTGRGMRPEVLRRATEPFFTTRHSSGGSGLGLSMVDGFVRQSGGELRLASTPGAGTTVTMVLPEAPLARIISEVRPPNKQGRFFGRSALLVEDNDRLRRVLELSLAEIGFVVSSAASGDAARQLLEPGPCPDLLFSDIRMPGQLNGVQLAAWTRAHCPEVRVLLQTGYAEEGAGEFPVLRKPFTAEELVQAIEAVLGSVKG